MITSSFFQLEQLLQDVTGLLREDLTQQQATAKCNEILTRIGGVEIEITTGLQAVNFTTIDNLGDLTRSLRTWNELSGRIVSLMQFSVRCLRTAPLKHHNVTVKILEMLVEVLHVINRAIARLTFFSE